MVEPGAESQEVGVVSGGEQVYVQVLNLCRDVANDTRVEGPFCWAHEAQSTMLLLLPGMWAA